MCLSPSRALPPEPVPRHPVGGKTVFHETGSLVPKRLETAALSDLKVKNCPLPETDQSGNLTTIPSYLLKEKC